MISPRASRKTWERNDEQIRRGDQKRPEKGSEKKRNPLSERTEDHGACRNTNFRPAKVEAAYGSASSTWNRRTSLNKTSRRKRATSEKTSSGRKRQSSRPKYRSVTPVSRHGMGRTQSKKWLAFLKQQEERRGRVKEEAKIPGGRLDNPTADSPAYHESGMSDEAIVEAKRGKQRTL